jgi:ATP-dependent Lon protease
MTAHILKDQSTIDAVMENQKNGVHYVGLFLRKDNLTEDIFEEDSKTAGNLDRISSIDQVHKIGTFAQVQQITKTDRGTQLSLIVHRRISLENVNSFGPPAIVKVNHISSPVVDAKSPLIKAYTNAVISALREIVRANPLSHEHFQDWVLRTDFNDPYKLSDFAASITSAEAPDLQRVMDSLDVEDRLRIVLELLNTEREIIKLQKELSHQV